MIFNHFRLLPKAEAGNRKLFTYKIPKENMELAIKGENMTIIYLQNEETANFSTIAKLFLTGITPMLYLLFSKQVKDSQIKSSLLISHGD